MITKMKSWSNKIYQLFVTVCAIIFVVNLWQISSLLLANREDMTLGWIVQRMNFGHFTFHIPGT